MKQYKIDAFKGYEKFMKKIGKKAGYICYISWIDKKTLDIRLSKPAFVKCRGERVADSTYMFDPTVERSVYRFDDRGKELDMYKATYDGLVSLHNDLRRMEAAFKEGIDL